MLLIILISSTRLYSAYMSIIQEEHSDQSADPAIVKVRGGGGEPGTGGGHRWRHRVIQSRCTYLRFYYSLFEVH